MTKEGAITGELSSETISVGDFRFEKVTGKNSWDLFEDADGVNGDEADALLDEFYETASGFGHKLGGYPGFTQEDPRTYVDQEHTVLLLQIDSDDEVDLMWGRLRYCQLFLSNQKTLNEEISRMSSIIGTALDFVKYTL
ncbi:hypothetical protein BsIDN1_69060 [Bacillus safensis]|uniref:Uncharacterized protein n=1 Tax=Bacillus safensis TaxID=561879 RepID=A0A5S9MJK1_BACIA|nr:hypothetical protein BsIDN1_69060 [Bacillus safensis]